MRILALNGSPRKEGNIAKLLREMTKDHAGIDLNYYNLNELSIKDCQGCYCCKKHETWAIKDDIQMLYKELKEADVLVLGSPIYFSTETATTRAFIDRMYTMLSFGDAPGRYVPRLTGKKKAIVVITCGNGRGKEAYANVKDRMFMTWGTLGFQEVHPYIIAGATSTGDVMELTDAQAMLKECRTLLGWT